ncbi:metalloprotease [Apiospora arundinis]
MKVRSGPSSDPSSHPSKIHPSVQTNPSSTTKAKATVPNSAHRVNKPNHQRQRKTQPTSKPRPKEWLTLEHGQAARAEVIYKALKSYARFVGRSPRIYEIRDDKLTLRLPSYGLFSLVRGSGFLRPSREVVRQAREPLLEDVQILHQLHIHWCPNLRYVRFQQESNTNILDPIIEGFNYAIDPSDDTVAWEEMARDRIQLLNNQFDVIEELASISPDTRQLPAVLPPDTVACMLSNYRKNDARTLGYLGEKSSTTSPWELVMCTTWPRRPCERIGRDSIPSKSVRRITAYYVSVPPCSSYIPV